MPPKQLHLLLAYREWLAEQPCHLEVESLERHLTRFWQWYQTTAKDEVVAVAS